MENIVTHSISFLSGTLFIGFVAWYAKNLIVEWLKNSIKLDYDKLLESHKAQLKAESDTAIETLKSQLQMVAAERNVRFSRIFEQTAAVVAEVYRKLLAMHDAAADYVSIIEYEEMGTKAQRRAAFVTQYTEFRAYFRPRAVYLPKATADKIQEFLRHLSEAVRTFRAHVEDADRQDTDKWLEADRVIREDLPKIRELLEANFRGIFGIDASTSVQ